MSFGGSRRLSLVEQKKLQWAKEREEMVGLCGLWGPVIPSSKTSDHIGLPSSQTTLTGDPGQSRSGNGNGEEYNSSTQYFQNSQNKRSSSLPPIGSRGWPKQQMEEECVERDDSVGTSGYNSDSAGASDPGGQAAAAGMGERERGNWPQDQELDEEGGGDRRRRQRLSRHDGWKKTEGSRWQSEENMEMMEACEGNVDAEVAARARWGDHGIGVGHLWEPASAVATAANISASRLPPVSGRGETPAWLSRGLDLLQCGERNGTDILVVSARDISTPSVSEPSGSDSIQDFFGRSFLRGQNVPLEANILAERQRRREKAISHQNAIRQQVEERDRKRREEREIRLKMEMAEEERLRQEQEKIRVQEQQERQKIHERQEAEAKRLAAMEEALNIARKTAKDANSRLRRRHIGDSRADEPKPKELHPPPDPTISQPVQLERENGEEEDDDVVAEKKNQHEEIVSEKRNEEIVQHTASRSSSPRKIVKTEEVLQQQPLPATQSWVPVVEMISPDGFPVRGLGVGPPSVLFQPSMSQDQFNSPYCFVSSDGNFTPLSVPYNNSIQLPLPFLPLTQNGLQQLALVIPPVQDGTRLLTPSKLRVRRREVGTQTSAGRRRGAASWDGLGSGTSQASKNSRSALSERPQWGVNRPGAKYVKQSDKDLCTRQRFHRNQRRRTIAPTLQLSGNNSNPRNRWWSTVQLSDDALSKTYLISSNLVSSDSSSSACGATKTREEDKGVEEECDAGDEQDDNEDSRPNSNHDQNSTSPDDLLDRLIALKVGLLQKRRACAPLLNQTVNYS